MTSYLNNLTIPAASSSMCPSRSSDRSKLTAAVAADQLDEYGTQAAPANPKKRSRLRKKKPKTASDEETEYITDLGSASESEDSDVEMVVQNEEVGILLKIFHTLLITSQLADALPSKTVPEKSKRKSGKAKSKRAKKVSHTSLLLFDFIITFI